jgi:hypothetical protein
MYAHHLGLMVVGSDGGFILKERCDEKREIGTFSTVDTLERGIEQYGERELRKLDGK